MFIFQKVKDGYEVRSEEFDIAAHGKDIAEARLNLLDAIGAQIRAVLEDDNWFNELAEDIIKQEVHFKTEGFNPDYYPWRPPTRDTIVPPHKQPPIC